MVEFTGNPDLKTVLLLRLRAGFPVLELLFGSPDEILAAPRLGPDAVTIGPCGNPNPALSSLETISAHSLPCPRSGWAFDDLVKLVVDIIPSDCVSHRSASASDSPARAGGRQASAARAATKTHLRLRLLPTSFSRLSPNDSARPGSQQHRESTIAVDQTVDSTSGFQLQTSVDPLVPNRSSRRVEDHQVALASPGSGPPSTASQTQHNGRFPKNSHNVLDEYRALAQPLDLRLLPGTRGPLLVQHNTASAVARKPARRHRSALVLGEPDM